MRSMHCRHCPWSFSCQEMSDPWPPLASCSKNLDLLSLGGTSHPPHVELATVREPMLGECDSELYAQRQCFFSKTGQTSDSAQQNGCLGHSVSQRSHSRPAALVTASTDDVPGKVHVPARSQPYPCLGGVSPGSTSPTASRRFVPLLADGGAVTIG